jgi:hypothetical protein
MKFSLLSSSLCSERRILSCVKAKGTLSKIRLLSHSKHNYFQLKTKTIIVVYGNIGSERRTEHNNMLCEQT